MFFAFLISIKFILLGAVYGRLDGGGIAKVSEWVERSLVMFSFVLACASFSGLWSLLAYLGVVGIATGHGQYFLARTVKYVKPEKFDFIVRMAFGPDPRSNTAFSGFPPMYAPIEDAMKAYGLKKLYWRCVFGMFVTGTLVGIPAFVIAAAFGKLYGVLFLLTGVVKAISYMIGWQFFKSTEPAEYINGGARNAVCLAVIFYALSIL